MKYKGQEIFQRKAEEILQVLSEPQVDLWKLRELALSDGGLVNDDLRCMAWPKLVGLHDRLFLKEESIHNHSNEDTKLAFVATASPRPSPRLSLKSKLEALNQHPLSTSSSHHSSDEHSQASSSVLSTRDRILAVCDDFEQIERDVARCTWHLLNGSQRQVAMQMEHKRHKQVRRLIQRKQRRLANLINLTLQQSYPFVVPKLRYYQGYHDVACVVLATLGGHTSVPGTTVRYSNLEQMASTMGLDLPAAVLLQMTQSHLADFCQASFGSLQTALKLTIFPLLWALDKTLHDHLQDAELEPFFLLSWVLTWFSHEIRDTELVKRLFDAFLVGHALLPLYTAIAMMLHPYNRNEILACECDFSLLHQTLQALPRNSSMVGWKFRPGDGYVSDHEESDDDDDDDDDDDIVALENQLLHSDDLAFLKKRERQSYDAPEAMSIESSLLGSSLVGAPKVPFQELIDHALMLMQRVPPKQLIPLATQYYGLAQVEQFLASASSERIHLLETPVEWSVTSSAPADWVLQQRAREERSTSHGSTESLSRKEYRNEQKRKRKSRRNSPSLGPLEDMDNDREDEELVKEYLKQHTHTRPVIALGYGRPKKPRITKKQQKQLLAVTTAIAVAVIAVLWGGRGESNVVVPPKTARTMISSRDSLDNSQTQSEEIGMMNQWNLDDLPELTDCSDHNDCDTTSGENTVVVATVGKEEMSEQRASVLPFPKKVGQAAHQLQSQVGQQVDTIRDKTAPRIQSFVHNSKDHIGKQIISLRDQSFPHIQKIVQQSKNIAAHLQHELTDLPETRWKELAVAFQNGLQQKALIIRETRPSIDLHPIGRRIQNVRQSIVWLVRTMMLESTRFVEHLQMYLNQHQLSDMPLQSIRMVRNMCGQQHKANIPFFCDQL